MDSVSIDNLPMKEARIESAHHLILGRQDYAEPAPLSLETLAQVAQCTVTPRRPDRTAPHHWHEVRVGNTLAGFVKTGMGG